MFENLKTKIKEFFYGPEPKEIEYETIEIHGRDLLLHWLDVLYDATIRQNNATDAKILKSIADYFRSNPELMEYNTEELEKMCDVPLIEAIRIAGVLGPCLECYYVVGHSSLNKELVYPREDLKSIPDRLITSDGEILELKIIRTKYKISDRMITIKLPILN